MEMMKRRGSGYRQALVFWVLALCLTILRVLLYNTLAENKIEIKVIELHDIGAKNIYLNN